MSITVSNITKFFGDHKVLKEVSFELKKGEIVGILGPRGSGKSTLLQILTSYFQADEGEAYVNSFDVSTEQKSSKKSIGYLPQHDPLYLGLYVSAYLNFNAEVYKTDKKRIGKVVEQMGITPELHKQIGQLSKCARQRVGLASAMLHDPDVLILDEPMKGLKPKQLLKIRRFIRKIGKEKTMLLSTGSVQEVEAVCDRVLIISQGAIVADKRLSDLRKDDEQIIEVEFDYRVEETFLNQLPHVIHVKNIAGFLYEITFETSKDMRPTVFDFAHDNELKTLQLSRKNENLESLFSALTM